MAILYGQSFTRADLAERGGDIGQFAGVRMGELADGFERGVRIADIRTGSGFEFTVLADRGLDIGAAHFGGAPLAWRSPAAFAHPAFFEPEGLGWLRGFGGGLVTTCGLTYFGAPTVEEGQSLGLHGRASNLPATNLAQGADWHGDECELWVSGQTREARLFGENVALRRRISVRMGESRLIIEDAVTNEAHESTPHMLLYHCNLGYPILSEHSELLIDDEEVFARDEGCAPGLPGHRRFEPPTPGYSEEVFQHVTKTDAEGYARAALVNRNFDGGRGLGVFVRWRAAELPWLNQWKMMGQGAYVLGLEPATNWTIGRTAERAAGRLKFLEPGETRNYRVEIGVLVSRTEIDAFAAQGRR
jgi:Domain of unknown function (DUF4432)